MKPPRKCCLCASKIIQREIAMPDRTLYLCPLHAGLCDDVVKLADSKRKAHA